MSDSCQGCDMWCTYMSFMHIAQWSMTMRYRWLISYIGMVSPTRIIITGISTWILVTCISHRTNARTRWRYCQQADQQTDDASQYVDCGDIASVNNKYDISHQPIMTWQTPVTTTPEITVNPTYYATSPRLRHQQTMQWRRQGLPWLGSAFHRREAEVGSKHSLIIA